MDPIVDMVSGFRVDNFFFSKDSGWTREMVEQAVALAESYYEQRRGKLLGDVEHLMESANWAE